MKNLALLFIISGCFIVFACKKETTSENFRLLTGPVWASDSLLAEGVDVSKPGQLLAKFVGDIKFREDGTGYFGQYTGTWRFSYNETELVISADSLPVPTLTTNIVELTTKSLKVTTSYPSSNQSNPFDIRMTFKAK
jgi:hypothetical protein